MLNNDYKGKRIAVSNNVTLLLIHSHSRSANSLVTAGVCGGDVAFLHYKHHFSLTASDLHACLLNWGLSSLATSKLGMEEGIAARLVALLSGEILSCIN